MNSGQAVLEKESPAAGDWTALQEQINQLEKSLKSIKRELPDDRVSIVVFSGDLDKVLASFVIATGAAASGMEVSMFFTFWGLSALRKQRSMKGKSLFQKMFGFMTPVGMRGLGVSKMNFGGIGSKMLRSMMEQQQVPPLEQMLQTARDLGVKITGCQMSMDVMGVRREEMIDGIEIGGVAAFLADATRSKSTLFI